MLRALTRQKRDGSVYTRRLPIEHRLLELAALDPRERLEALRTTNRSATAYVPSECVVHFMREAYAAGERKAGDAYLMVLRNRARLAFKRAIHGNGSHEEALREEALSKFDVLVAVGLEPGADRLDYLEVNFDHALVTLRKDLFEAERRRSARLIPLRLPGDEEDEERPEIEFAAPVSELACELGMQESEFEAFRNDRLRSINVLLDEQRDAILYLLGGLPIGSSDPKVDTIARRQGVDESTVRYRIKRGIARLNEPLGDNQ
jgi:hypothetical protein